MDRDDFLAVLRSVGARDTSADPEGWTVENPLWGHCAVAALLAQDQFGGSLVRGSLEGNKKYAYLHSHYWNRLPNGEVDFTGEQYPDLKFRDLVSEVRERERVLRHPETQRRYEVLKQRFLEQVRDGR